MAPPANDNFASATSIATASGTLGGTTFDATKEASESTTIGTNVQSVWYVFTVPTTGWYKFWIPASDMVDHDIRAFDNGTIGINVFPDGALSAMTLTNEIADGFRGSSGSPKDAQVAFFATSSTVLRIRVYSSMDSAAPGGLNTQTMDFTLHWAQLSRPTSDDLANVIDLGSVPVAETGITTFDATMESGEQQALSVTSSYSTTDPAVQSVWYKFTPAVSGKYHFRVENVVNQGNDHQETRLQVSTQSTLAGYTVANELGHLSFGFVAGTANGYFDLVGGTDYYILS